MPSHQDASSGTTTSTDIPQPPAQAHASPAVSFAAPRPSVERQQAQRLAEASRALWIATLSLMTAFMQATGPAHKYLIARRISRNLDTLSRQECFDAGCRASFVRLSGRWQQRSLQFAPESPRPPAGPMRLFR